MVLCEVMKLNSNQLFLSNNLSKLVTLVVEEKQKKKISFFEKLRKMSKQEKNNPRLETFQRRWQIAICMFDVDAIIELKTSKRFDPI